ncbi:MAG: cytochrome c [Acidobacteria bacterium]|nr:cytochrome c [Acidobacteriota bacterium]
MRVRALVFTFAAALCLGRAGGLDQVPPEADLLPNPYQGQRSAEMAGAKLYRRYCASCHGKDSSGAGPHPSLRSPAVAAASPGALFWLLRNGSLRRGMPSWSHLPDQQRWQLVTYLKTLRQ